MSDETSTQSSDILVTVEEIRTAREVSAGGIISRGNSSVTTPWRITDVMFGRDGRYSRCHGAGME